MRVLVTGATGLIGGSVAARLAAAGHQVVGLVRSPEGARDLRARGIEPLPGTLADLDLLAEAAATADAVVNAADTYDPYVVEALLPALAGTGRPLIHTSGSGVVADHAAGGPGDGRIFHEDTPFEPVPAQAVRVALDRQVLAAAASGVSTVVIRPSMIYGQGLGSRQDSFQPAFMIAEAKRAGVARHVGPGLNSWSHVHVEDLADLYLLALTQAPPGSLFYAEHGEATMREIAEAITRLLALPTPPEPWPLAEAAKAWGPARARVAFGSNSRVRAAKARAMLGWHPKGPPLLHDLEHGSYRRLHRPEGA